MTDKAGLVPRAGVVFQFASFPSDRLIHGMSGRLPDSPSEGDVAYARDADPSAVTENRKAFLEALGIPDCSLTLGGQVHGNTVTVVTSADRGRGRPPQFDAIPSSDGLATVDTGLALGSIVADCTPVVLYDPVKHAVALVHAGWRGTAGLIAANAVQIMVDEFGSRPEELIAGIGPSIGPCCYEVGDEVIDAWMDAGIQDGEKAVVARQPRNHLDLWAANRLTLIHAGVPERQIEIAGLCTRCVGDRYFSHRAAMAGERPRGRMIMVVALNERVA